MAMLDCAATNQRPAPLPEIRGDNALHSQRSNGDFAKIARYIYPKRLPLIALIASLWIPAALAR